MLGGALLAIGPSVGCTGEAPSDSDSAQVVTCEDTAGSIYQVGESYDDDCNTCTCQSDGTISCTDLGCF